MTVMSELSEDVLISYLSNPDTYKLKLVDTLDSILKKYIKLINEYINLFNDNIKIIDKNYYDYLLLNGLKTLNNVFLLILLYTNNLNITYFFGQKSYYYYVEFISQIDNINHSFLELTGKDASLFVYKKTIFELDNNKKNNENNEINKLINLFINISTKLFTFIYNNNLKINKNKDNINNILLIIVNCFIDKEDILNYINEFLEYFLVYKNNLDELETYLILISKKIKKKNIIKLQINNINNKHFDNINSITPQNFINLLFS